MMETLKIKRGPRRPNRRRKEKSYEKHHKNHPNSQCRIPGQDRKRFRDAHGERIDKGAAAVRADLKQKCTDENVKFLGEYDVIGTDENLFSMDIETFVRYAQTIH